MIWWSSVVKRHVKTTISKAGGTCKVLQSELYRSVDLHWVMLDLHEDMRTTLGNTCYQGNRGVASLHLLTLFIPIGLYLQHASRFLSYSNRAKYTGHVPNRVLKTSSAIDKGSVIVFDGFGLSFWLTRWEFERTRNIRVSVWERKWFITQFVCRSWARGECRVAHAHCAVHGTGRHTAAAADFPPVK